jgi:hypothetical protein
MVQASTSHRTRLSAPARQVATRSQDLLLHEKALLQAGEP